MGMKISTEVLTSCPLTARDFVRYTHSVKIEILEQWCGSLCHGGGQVCTEVGLQDSRGGHRQAMASEGSPLPASSGLWCWGRGGGGPHTHDSRESHGLSSAP